MFVFHTFLLATPELKHPSKYWSGLSHFFLATRVKQKKLKRLSIWGVNVHLMSLFTTLWYRCLSQEMETGEGGIWRRTPDEEEKSELGQTNLLVSSSNCDLDFLLILYLSNSEMQKTIWIAQIQIWPQKISTKNA